jgi:hypothetical protein
VNRFILLLFAIPVLSILGIAIYQFVDEMTRKRFVLERRQRAADEAGAGVQRRRYSDSVPPGTLRNPDTASSTTKSEVSVPQVHGA